MPQPPVYLPTQIIIDLQAKTAVPIVEPADVDDHTARVLYARNVTELTGQCPECGARMHKPNRARRRVAMRDKAFLRVTVAHEDDCPAADQTVRQWTRLLTEKAR